MSYRTSFVWLKARRPQRRLRLIEQDILMKCGELIQAFRLVQQCFFPVFHLPDIVLDLEHYLANQILPPIERLCAPIEGTDRSRLAECLGTCLSFSSSSCYSLIGIPGLDPGLYRNLGGGVEEKSFSALDSQMSDTERFKDASPFLVRCRQCQGEVAFAPLNDRQVRAVYLYSP